MLFPRSRVLTFKNGNGNCVGKRPINPFPSNEIKSMLQLGASAAQKHPISSHSHALSIPNPTLFVLYQLSFKLFIKKSNDVISFASNEVAFADLETSAKKKKRNKTYALFAI